MILELAQRCTARLKDWLGPFCERIEVAGSIRRCRGVVGDIDLVVIPKIHERHDLFGQPEARDNLTAMEIQRRCTAEGWRVDKAGEDYISFVTSGSAGKEPVQVDIWFAAPETFGTVWLCRTGSASHNITLSQRAQALGGHWQPHKGVTIRGRRHAASTEAEVFAALNLPFVNPEDRH